MFNNQWDEWDQWEVLEEDFRRAAVRRSRRIVPDRMNPFTTMRDTEFIGRFRLRKESVNDIILEIQDHLPDSTDRRGCRVPPHLQVLLAIAAMAGGSHQVEIGDCYDVSQQFVSAVLARVARAIAGLGQNHIKFPAVNSLTSVMQDFYAIDGMPGVIGCIDCTHIKIARPPREDSEVFRCRKGFFSLNIQAICGPDLRFYNVVARWQGSVHDARIFLNSRIHDDLQDGLLPGHLLGDSGYGCRKYLLTPLEAPRNVHERRYNESHIKTRNTIERAFGVLKRRFSYLGKAMRTQLETTKAIVVASAVLHNIAVATRINMEDVICEVDANLQNVQNAVVNNNEAGDGTDEPLQGRMKRASIIRDYF